MQIQSGLRVFPGAGLAESRRSLHIYTTRYPRLIRNLFHDLKWVFEGSDSLLICHAYINKPPVISSFQTSPLYPSESGMVFTPRWHKVHLSSRSCVVRAAGHFLSYGGVLNAVLLTVLGISSVRAFFPVPPAEFPRQAQTYRSEEIDWQVRTSLRPLQVITTREREQRVIRMSNVRTVTGRGPCRFSRCERPFIYGHRDTGEE